MINFNLGRCCGTPAAITALSNAKQDIEQLLSAHAQGLLWNGKQSVENLAALAAGERIFSTTACDDREVWIITEADRSMTTILLSSEY